MILMHRRIREKIQTYLQHWDDYVTNEIMAGSLQTLWTPVVDWDNYDPLDVLDGQHPAVGVYINSQTNHRRTDISDPLGGGNEITSLVNVIVSISATNKYLGLDDDGVDSWEEPARAKAIERIQDMTEFFKQGILDSPNFNVSRTSLDNSIELIDGSLSINYSEPMRPSQRNGTQWVAASQLSFQLRVVENIERPNLGTVRKTSVRAYVSEELPPKTQGEHP